MSLAKVTITIATTMLAAFPGKTAAQDSTASAARPAVYSDQQAARGRDIYLGICQGCHTTASHTGAEFQNGWAGRTLSDLFRYVSQTMPKNDPASLSAQEYADVVAYLLKLNGLPSGKDELPTDTTTLGKMRLPAAKKEH